MNIQYRKATIEDLYEIMEMIKFAVFTMENSGIYQWDEVYPDKSTIKSDIENGELYIGKIDGRTAVIYVINQFFDDEYKNGEWQYPNVDFRIIHRLCVHPDFQNKGVAKAVMQHIETKLRKSGVEAIRLDAFSENPYALRLYESFGYKTEGFADWRKGKFHLMEKNLTVN